MKFTLGRNDPCSCGSGLKFKKCCIDKKSDLEQDFELGQQRIKEYEKEQRGRTDTQFLKLVSAAAALARLQQQ